MAAFVVNGEMVPPARADGSLISSGPVSRCRMPRARLVTPALVLLSGRPWAKAERARRDRVTRLAGLAMMEAACQRARAELPEQLTSFAVGAPRRLVPIPDDVTYDR